jgi:flagellar biosynthesis protein FlhA
VHESARAEAESLGYTVVDARVRDRHAPDRDDPRPRGRAAHAPGRARAARPPQGDQRRRRRRGRAGRALARRDPAGAAIAAGEGVPIRDLGTIVEAIGDKARTTRDTSLLSEYARQALGRAITAPHLDEQLRLQAITLDPSIEQEVSTSITQTTDGEYLAMEPTRARRRSSARFAPRSSTPPASRRRAPGAALLGAHPPPSAPPDRPGPAAPGGLLLQRDRPRHQR